MKYNFFELLIVFGMLLGGVVRGGEGGPFLSDSAALRSEGKAQGAREYIIIYVTDEGRYELDSGRLIKSLDELIKLLKDKNEKFIPRLILSSKKDDARYYRSAMKAILVFESNCEEYSVFVQNGDSADE